MVSWKSTFSLSRAVQERSGTEKERNVEPKWSPNGSPNGAKTRPKKGSKNKTIFGSILVDFGTPLGALWGLETYLDWGPAGPGAPRIRFIIE